MMGLESQGMLLMAKDRAGRLTPVWTESEPGSTVA
jgi:methionyl-tRNA synthetase